MRAKHRSPNAGWPEARRPARSASRSAGPRRYGERIVDDPFLNAEARKDATPDDIGRALDLLVAACLLQAAAYAALALVALTAARDRQNPLEIEMRFEMIGERVERRFDAGLVGQRRRDAEAAPRHAWRKASPAKRPCT